MKNQNNGRNLIIAILILFAFIFFTKKCTNEIKGFFGESKEIDLRYSNDSIRIQFEKQKILSEKLELALEIANKELLVAQNNSQVSETKLYNLQNKFKRPAYVPELQPCNDSIQVQYKYSIQKDSACNETIAFKNTEIDKLNIKVYILDTTKANLTDFVKTMEAEKNFDKKVVQVEKSKKTFWQYTTGVLAVVSIFFGLR